jgi:hypothetical protein
MGRLGELEAGTFIRTYRFKIAVDNGRFKVVQVFQPSYDIPELWIEVRCWSDAVDIHAIFNRSAQEHFWALMYASAEPFFIHFKRAWSDRIQIMQGVTNRRDHGVHATEIGCISVQWDNIPMPTHPP